MASTTTFGDFPGVRVETTGGAITNVVVGRDQKLILIGEGDSVTGSATAGVPTEVDSRRDADIKFGADTHLANNIRDALSNGANLNFLYGLMVEEVTVTDEDLGTAASGTLANAPIIEDASTITFTDTTAAVDLAVEFRYESPPASPAATDTVYINPLTGEWAADASAAYVVDYEYANWESAIDAAESVFKENEVGIICTLSDAESVGAYLSGLVAQVRGQYKMARGLSAAQPNISDSVNNDAQYDTVTYTDNVDNDSMFLFAPSRKKDKVETYAGAVAGLFAGNALDDPVYNDALNVDYDLEQEFSKAQAEDMRAQEVMPVRDLDSVYLRDNISTSTEVDWKRDYWRRRIVDQVILIAKQVGEAIVGRINNEDTRKTAQDLIAVELRALARSRLIKPNTTDETNWYVDVYEKNSEEVGIDIGITPFGIVRRVDISLTVNA